MKGKEQTLVPQTKVRFYEGYKGRQVPRSVQIGTREQFVVSVFSQKRIFDHEKNTVRETFRCLLDNRRLVEIEVGPDGKWNIRFD
jgi:hypothetical protein